MSVHTCTYKVRRGLTIEYLNNLQVCAPLHNPHVHVSGQQNQSDRSIQSRLATPAADGTGIDRDPLYTSTNIWIYHIKICH